MWIEVQPVPSDALMSRSTTNGSETAAAIEHVASARALQRARYTKDGLSLNCELNARTLYSHISLTDEQKNILRKAAERLHLSPRGVHRVMRLSRTIADLDQSPEILNTHVLEALQYRAQLQS